MQYINVLNLTPDELKKEFNLFGVEGYRSDQILQWIYDKSIYDFDKMTNLSVELRKKLKERFNLNMPRLVESEKSIGDKSVKFLLKLEGGDLVETVYMPMKDRQTVCISSQVGCKFHCAFCEIGRAHV